MLKKGKMNEIANEMTTNKIDIGAIQEIRWKGAGQIRKDSYTMYYSGEETQGRNGVGFIINNKLEKKVIEFKPINGRIAKVRIKSKPFNTTIINIYAPTENAEEEEKTKMYDKIEETIQDIPKQDTIIIMGDFNAQIGKEDYNNEVAGKETIHEVTNNNGSRLCNLAAMTGLTIASTKFKHNKKIKATWITPNGKNENQIDHILITKKRQTIIQDVKSARGPCADTDHFMVVAKVQIKQIKNPRTKIEKIKWNVEELTNEETRKEYEQKLTNELEQINETEIEEEWGEIKKAINKAANHSIGKENKRKGNDWWNEKCKKAVDEKAKTWKVYIENINEENKQKYVIERDKANEIIRYERNEYIDKKIETVEKENRSNNGRKFYRQIKALNTKQKRMIKGGVRDRNGKIAETEEEEKEAWREYFMEMLTEDDENMEMTPEETQPSTQPEEETPTREEIEEIVKTLRNGKAAGKDNIGNELIKYGGEQLITKIHKLIKEIWEKEAIPEEWEIGQIIPIHKSGEHTICDNYRGITKLCNIYKILTTSIYKKLTKYIKIGEYQCGFTKGRSTVDAIHTVKQIIHKANEYNVRISIMFLDFKKAFDSLKRTEINKIINNIQIPAKLKKLLIMLTTKTAATVITRRGETEEFKINKGVRQGDTLSAAIFTIALDHILRNIDTKGTIKNRGVQVVAYADDLTIIAKQQTALKETVQEIIEEGKKIGLEINTKKTKIMTTTKEEQKREIKLGNNTYECVQKFKYLGVTLNCEGNNDEEINERIMASNRAYYANIRTLKSKKLRKRTKIKMYKTIIRPITTYAAETLTMTQKQEEKIEIFERKVMRNILGPHKIQEGIYKTRTNKEIEEELNGETIIKTIKQQRIRWLGHIWRKDSNDPTKQILDWKPAHKRRRGRPRKTWMEEVKRDLTNIGIKRWEEKTKDRKTWQEITHKIK